MINVSFNNFPLSYSLPVLAMPEYLSSKSSSFGWFWNDKFMLPFFIDKRFIFKRLVFTMEPILCSGLYSAEDEKSFLNDTVHLCKKKKICDFISKAQSNAVFNVCPDNCDVVPWGTYEVDLQKTKEELLASFDGKHRNVIKKALKDGVVAYASDDVDLIFNNIRETLARQQSIHYPSKNYLNKLLVDLPNNVLFFCSSYDGALQGCAVIVYDERRAYYMYGGSIQNPYSGSINLLQYEAMLLLQSKNVKTYDLVGARIDVEKGSKYEGIQRFKSRFGAFLKQGYAFRVVIKPVKFFMFNISVALYLNLKGIKYQDPISELLRTK